jgi:hypothetical protein
VQVLPEEALARPEVRAAVYAPPAVMRAEALVAQVPPAAMRVRVPQTVSPSERAEAQALRQTEPETQTAQVKRQKRPSQKINRHYQNVKGQRVKKIAPCEFFPGCRCQDRSPEPLPAKTGR